MGHKVFCIYFQDPVPPEPWEGVRDALKEGDICIHHDIIIGGTKGSEDCLYLNVFTPQVRKLPIFIYFVKF